MIEIPDYIKDLKPYVPGRTINEIKQQYDLDEIHKIASNENPLGPSPIAVEAMRDAMKDVHRYPDIGAMKLRKRIGEMFNLDVENIAVGNGSEGVLAVAMRCFLHGDDEVITSEGTFIGFQVLARARVNKCEYIPMPKDNYKFDLDGIANAINEKTKLIYLCNPNNPTGTIFTKDEFEKFIEKVPPNVLIIFDEAYYEFASDYPEYPDSMNYRLDNVLTLRTFSKAYGIAGIRIGYGFAHKDIVETIMKVKLPFEPGNVAQEGAYAALGDTEFLERTKHLNKTGMEYLTDEFTRLGMKWFQSYANFIMADFNDEQETVRINEELLKRGVIVRPLTAFGLPGCMRFTIGRNEENEALVKALREVI